MGQSFSPAEHQLIGMKISYRTEDYVAKIQDPKNLRREMLQEYHDLLEDKNISFVKGVPQFSKEKVPSVPGILGSTFKTETGFHANAITRGDPKNPEEIVITFAGTDFSDPVDVDQTFIPRVSRLTDYSDTAIDYVKQIKEKYPDAKISANGQSMAGKLVMQIGVVYPDIEVYAFNPTTLDRKFYKLIEDGKAYDNINVLIYDHEIAGVERWFGYGFMLTSTKNLPFNFYHIDSENAGFSIKSHLHRHHGGMAEQHSTGGFRSPDGSLMDVFNLNPIDFSGGGGGTSPIVFDKDRYVRFAKILQHDIVYNLKKALTLLEAMEDNVHSRMKSIVNRAEQDIEHIPFEPGVIYRDPRPGAVQSLRETYYKAGKYRCYDNEAFTALVDSLDHARKKIHHLALTIHETANDFEKREEEISRSFDIIR